MNIRMYNCYFGDCFRVENELNNDLMVDFGIERTCIDAQERTQRFDDIYLDIKDKKVDFLLSHYHDDHFNGAIYICDQFKYKFQDIYIPDVWSYVCKEAVELLVLSDLLESYYVSNEFSIIAFLKLLCNDKRYVYFVQRGSKIQHNKYVALWPSKEYVLTVSKRVLKNYAKRMNIDEADIIRLEYIADQLRNIVLQINSRDFTSDVLFQGIGDLEDNLLEFAQRPTIRSLKPSIKLSSFGNNISIVFHNVENDVSENILFTGDLGKSKSIWEPIENNIDAEPYCDMHSCYHAIKVSHHGTSSYYRSFVNLMDNNSVLMIPNDGERHKWNVSSDYSLNAVTTGAKTVCSTCRACEAKINNCNLCSCMNRHVIEPDIFYDIN